MNNQIQNQIQHLQSATYELLHLGEDGSGVYVDHFRDLNITVLEQTDALYKAKVRVTTVEEEAMLCYTLLIGYSVTTYDSRNREKRIQTLLNRSWKVLDKLSDSLLKLQLLNCCYQEIHDDDLLADIHRLTNLLANA